LHRRVVPRGPRWPGWGFRDHRARRRAEHPDDPDGSGAVLDVAAEAGADATGCLGELPGIGAILGVLAAVLLLWFVVLPALVFVLDVVLVVLLTALTIAARVVFRRPWTVVARTEGPPTETVEWRVTGWRASDASMRAAERRIARGGDVRPPRARGREPM
jgi:hypothetical protein